jgi:hypothetical protein
MAFQPKGTGAIDLAAGSRGVNISNGGTVTAITRTNVGAGYTSVPTITISAPTTAGGVQATASVTSMGINFVTIVNGGTGYAVNDEILISGGTFTTQARYRITAVSAGVVTTLTPIATPNYQALPTNPASTTAAIGTGSGLTLTVNWAVTGQSFTAGSGYIEQPTVTFSGGGGSGAAAYATVGSGTIVRSLGSTLSFNTPQGEQVRITDAAFFTGGATPALNIFRDSSNRTQLRSAGNLTLYAQTGGSIGLYTNIGSDLLQLNVSHTASAVNYVQVTGSTTGNFTAISAQGSDTNVSLSYISKGTGQHIFATNSSSGNGQFRVLHTAGTIANYGTVTGNVAGSAPVFSVAGSDTNIDLALTPKGTGLVRFGTYVAGALLATGYINIKAADGTTYKVLVST